MICEKKQRSILHRQYIRMNTMLFHRMPHLLGHVYVGEPKTEEDFKKGRDEARSY